MRLAPAEEAVRVAAASSTAVKIEGVTVKVEEEVALLPHYTVAALFTVTCCQVGEHVDENDRIREMIMKGE
jgi:hypothetical protein